MKRAFAAGEPGGISFVVTSRNDDHGGDLLRRTRLCLGALLDQAHRHGLRGELILVEWNPPAERPRLLEALGLRFNCPDFPLRVIEVPPHIHARLPRAEVLPLFQMIAKNVGVRRARYPFILATNPDLLFSEELIAFLARTPLDPRLLYRIDRIDVRREIPFELDVAATLAWCERNMLRIHGRRGSREVRRGRPALSVLAMMIERGRHKLPEVALKMLQVLLGIRPPPVHTNACGDFSLMAREHWLTARAYAEFPLYSMHIDSLLIYSAVGLGLKTKILRRPMRLYHIDHGKSWSSTDINDRFRDFVRHPWVDLGLVEAASHRAFFGREPIIFNDGDWGLGTESLPERTVSSWPDSEMRLRLASTQRNIAAQGGG